MKFKFPQIPMPLFYKLGSILFSCSAIGTAINLKLQWETSLIGTKIGGFATFFFQILLVTLFIGFYFATKNQPKVIENPELDDFLQELKADDELKKENEGERHFLVEDDIIANQDLKNLEKLKGGKLGNGKKNIVKN